jgi:putative phosphoserine phosphatase/1-acylglycerol-3-phosphate O-acyltransferase
MHWTKPPSSVKKVQEENMGDTAALFDMDHTITWKNSGLTSVQFACRHGMVPTLFLLKGLLKIALYRFSLMNIESWYERNMELLAGLTLEDMDRFSKQWFEEMVRNSIYREAVDLIRTHEEKGHKLAIISNAPEFFVKPLAKTLGIDDIICTRVEIEGSVLTGKLIKPLCYGEGKKEYAVRWAGENSIDLDKSYFYTDSFYDIELMKFIGFPIAVNPDRKMKKTARQNNWPVLLFEKIPAF